MDRYEIKELLPAMTHFANGGNLWCYDANHWEVQGTVFTRNSSKDNIIEDHNFEARKAHALGQNIQFKLDDEWIDLGYVAWLKEHEYRIKPTEPVFEWQFLYFQELENKWDITEEHYTINGAHSTWTKFEPSKRLRK